MTDDEKRKVAAVIAEVDSGCSTCVARATKDLEKLLPGQGWAELVDASYRKAWGHSIMYKLDDDDD